MEININGFRTSLVFLVITVLVYSQHGVEGRKMTRKDLMLQRHLKALNKPALKTIQSEDGDIIDCVDIYKQLAFDHPSLQNHTIQMKPSYYPEGMSREAYPEEIPQIWRRSGSCPQGTIPVRRNQKQDLIRSPSLSRFGKKEPGSIYHPTASQTMANQGANNNHALALEASFRYYGAKAAINVWNPYVEPNDFSSARMWLLAGNYATVNTIEVGWIVYPTLFNDSRTRFFAYWTGDGYQKTGCYNLLCPGFVQTSKNIALGAAIEPVSASGGKQYQIDLFVYKDLKSGNWWLQCNGEVVGYWPGSLFPVLGYSADLIEWGGEVSSPSGEKPHTTTGMGSGTFPGIYGRSSFFKDIKIIDNSQILKNPEHIRTFSDHPYCYFLEMGGEEPNDAGIYFYYGGPGRNPNCP